jgi:hypothetical protein
VNGRSLVDGSGKIGVQAVGSHAGMVPRLGRLLVILLKIVGRCEKTPSIHAGSSTAHLPTNSSVITEKSTV